MSNLLRVTEIEPGRWEVLHQRNPGDERPRYLGHLRRPVQDDAVSGEPRWWSAYAQSADLEDVYLIDGSFEECVEALRPTIG